MNRLRPTLLVIALAAAFPAGAQSNDELLKELRALRDRVTELEKKLGDAQARPAAGQWGMTPEQAAEFNRISVKTESMQDAFTDQGYKGLTISGYIEPVFVWNRRQNRAGFQFLNSQADGYAYDTSYMGSASIDFKKETESGTLWRLTLTPGRGVGEVIGASIVQEASVAIPLGDLQTKFIAGLVPDWSGYEYQQPTLNPFTSHNLLYDFTLPTGYIGAGLDITEGKWWVRTMLANVNTTIRSADEKAPVWVYRADYSRGEFDGFGFAGLHGKTPNFNTGTSTTTHLFEVDGYTTIGDWTLQGQVSYGQQKQGAITPAADGSYRDARWYGLSGLVGYAYTPRLQLLARADYIRNTKNGGGLFGYNGYSFLDEDPDSATFGQVLYGNDGRNGLGPDLAGDLNRGANRYALTLGMKYLYNENTTFKAELRFDGADRRVFEDVRDGGYAKSNQMFATSVVVAY